MKLSEVIQQPGQKEQLMKDDVFRSLHVATPGEIVSYNENTRTAVIQPTIRDGKSTQKPPLLVDVPVFFAGNFTFVPQPGDGCLVVFADACIDGWFKNGGVSSPISDRHHSLSDGFAFVGFRQTGGTPMGGGGGGAGCVIHEYTVSNTSGSYSHTFTDSSILAEMKPILIEASDPSVFVTNNCEVTPGDGTVKVESENLTGETTITVTFIGGPGQGNYVFIRYAAHQPTQDSDMKTTPDAWMGIYTGTSVTAPTAYTEYTWYKIKGDKGTDGTSAYVHIKYSATEPTQDSDMKDTPDAWMGICSGTSPIAPTTYSSYAWNKVRGDDGTTPVVYGNTINMSSSDSTKVSEAIGAINDKIGTVPSGKTVEGQISSLNDQIGNVNNSYDLLATVSTGTSGWFSKALSHSLTDYKTIVVCIQAGNTSAYSPVMIPVSIFKTLNSSSNYLSVGHAEGTTSFQRFAMYYSNDNAITVNTGGMSGSFTSAVVYGVK